ncbi:MAG: hemerythrin family protein [Lachnospiraceae bacterium]|nr:hemerythrin family protein [Lachnospiraceae bacterium]
METIEWDEKFNIGVEIVDKAHAKLFKIFRKLTEISPEEKNSQHTYKEGIKYLETYSMTHFSEEEAYMRSIRYNGYAQHKRLHDNFRDKTLVSLKKDLELSNYSKAAVQRFAGIVSNWVAEHIMKEDQAIVGKAGTRKNYDISAQIPLISKTVNRTMLEVFQVEAKLASANYKGQNIGEGYYCYRYYDTESGLRIQFLLGAEEPLLLRGASLLTGKQAVQKEDITEEMVLQVFGQLFQNLSKLFRVETEHEFEKENLLTRENFRKNFMKGYPCSLLFNTKSGYFIFCYRSWRVKKQKAEAAQA